jgi:hypothetical protein
MKTGFHSLSRLVMNLVIVLTMLGTAASPTSTADETDTRYRSAESPASQQDIPAPPAGGPRPTITLHPNHGYFGQSVAVYGQGIAPYPGVRLAWLTGDATMTAAVVNVGAAQAYSATLTVPTDAVPGPAKICAAVTGTAMAEFACEDFTIDAPPPGSVLGQLPLTAHASLRALDAQAFNATFVLRNNSGAQIASTPIQPNGSFTIAQAPPGTYQGAVVGNVQTLVGDAPVDVSPGKDTRLAMAVYVLPSPGGGRPSGKTCDSTSNVTATLARVSALDMTPSGTFVSLGSSGSPVIVGFTASLQLVTGTVVSGVAFSIILPDKTETPIITDTNSADGWQAAYNVSLLPEGDSYIVARPILASGCGVWNSQVISVIANPIADPLVRDDGRIEWNSGMQQYDFSGTLPDIAGALPIMYPKPPPDLPLLGEIRNQLDAGVYFEGSLGLDRKIRLQITRPYALAELLSLDIYNRSMNLPVMEMTVPDCPLNSPMTALCLAQHRDWQKSLRVNYKVNPLYEFNREVPVFRAPLASFWGIVTVNASVSVGIGGKLILEGWIYPLAPRLESTLTPEVSAYLKVSIWVDILLGVVSAGADATARVTVGMPLNLDTAASPPAWLGDPYLQIRVYLDLWARVNVWFWKKKWNLSSYELLNYSTGGGNVSAQGIHQAEEPPRVMASPAIASGPGGRMLSAYIEDTTPAVLTPTMQVMARFWITQTGAWGPPASLTDGSHAVNDPAVAFVGSDGHALAAWSENTMTAAEDDAAGDDLSAILDRQEIYYADWNGSAWSAPQRLTNDTLSDGRAALAGDALGATLAWVRDTDGNISTRADWRIAVTHWNTATLQWGPVELLDGVTAATGTARQSVLQKSDIRSDDLAAQAAPTRNAPAAELRVCDTCAYTNVQSAVDAANPGDIVKVAAGMYTGVQMRGGLTQTVYISKTLTLRGGYATTNWTTPNPETNYTTLDAQNMGRVLYITGNISPTIEGLRITGGNAAGLGPGAFDRGGGVYVLTATAVISNSKIFSNTAHDWGGGVYLDHSSAVLSGSEVANNTALQGGGVYLTFSNATLRENRIAFNTTTGAGGGLYQTFGNTTLVGNLIGRNIGGSGGGMYLSGNANLYRNTIDDNTASDGGGLYLNGNAMLDSNIVRSNTATSGGGVYVRYGDSVLTNTVIADNQSTWGAGLYVFNSKPRLWHTTFARNMGESGIYATDNVATSTVAMTNTILVSHTAGIVALANNQVTLNGVLWYSNTANASGAGAFAATNVYTGNPAFAADGYHLTQGSAAIDRGVSAGVTTDVDGELRPRDSIPDLGADEYIPCSAVVSGTAFAYSTVQAAVDAASTGDTVKVAGSCTGVQARAGVTQTVYISKTINLRGGYTTTNWATANPLADPTTLDAQGKGRVLYITGNISPTIEGLCITGGNADLGGGLYVITAAITLSNNRVFSNTASVEGGGLYLQRAPTATLTGNIISSNTASFRGGGIDLYDSIAALTGNTVTLNTANEGGGLRLYFSDITLGENTVASNHALEGGGLYIQGSTSATVLKENTISFNTAGNGGGISLRDGLSALSLNANTITSNVADGQGGGLSIFQSSIAMSGNAVTDNTAGNDGGGLYLDDSDITLSGDRIAFNFAARGGGLYLSHFSEGVLTNTVVAYNQASTLGGGLYSAGSVLRSLHTTLAGNSGEGSGVYAGSYLDVYDYYHSTAALTNTILVSQMVGVNAASGNTAVLNGVLWYGNTSNTGGSGAITVTHAYTGAPAFAADGYHLTLNSAAIDRGLDAGVTTDIDGDIRPQRGGFDLGADEWAGWMNAQVSVARTDGQIALAWTVDEDSQLTTNGDRRITVADLSPGGWRITLPNELPSGADSPSVVFRGPDDLQVAFVVRGKDGDGVTDTGIGNQAVLWTAQRTASGWSAAPVRDEQGEPVRAEQPKLSAGIGGGGGAGLRAEAGGAGETLLLFRRFGEVGTNGYLGQLALTQVVSGSTGSPLYLTDDPLQHWQSSVAINQATQEAVIVHVKRATAEASAASAQRRLAPASAAAHPTVQSAMLAANSDPVEALTLGPGADPALDPALALSQRHAISGTTIVVTATVRNVGRGAASGLSVRLYAGTPATGTLLSTTNVPVGLSLNETYRVGMPVTAGAGAQPLSAQVSTTGSDLNSANNIAMADLGELPPPTLVQVNVSARHSNTLQVSWQPPAASGVMGYRILRSQASGGPYELVGEAMGSSYSDVMLERDRYYYYVVQAYDSSGVRSVYSSEARGLLPLFRVYLPLVLRIQ